MCWAFIAQHTEVAASTLCSVQFVKCAVYSVCTLQQGVYCALYSVCSVCSAACSMCSVHSVCSVCSVQKGVQRNTGAD